MDADRSAASKAASNVSKTVGKINDRTKVILVRATGEGPQKALDVSIIKATNHNKVPPKEKHIQILLQYMQWPATSRYINRELVKRSHVLGKWLIALKCCLTHHRLLRESRAHYARHLTEGAAAAASGAGAPQFGAGSATGPPSAKGAAAYSHPSFGGGATGPPGYGGVPSVLALQGLASDVAPPLGLSTFRDGSCKKAFDISTFIRAYAAYLDTLVDVFAKTQYLPVASVDPGNLKELSIEKASEMMVQLSRISAALVASVPVRLAAASELVQVALHFLNFEARHLYSSLSQLQLGVVDRFFDLSPAVAKGLLDPMDTSLTQSDELAKYMRLCSQIVHTRINATELKPVCDAEFMQAMKDHANGEANVEPPPVYEPPAPEPEPEPEPVEDEESEAEEEEAVAEEPEPAAPEELPDLMGFDSPKASGADGESEAVAAPEEEDTNDELADLWKGGPQPQGPPGYGGHPGAHPGGINPFAMPPTGTVIRTHTFLAGPTGMAGPNPLLMPMPAGSGAPRAAGPNPNNPFAQQLAAGKLEDLSASALGFVKRNERPAEAHAPMRAPTGGAAQMSSAGSASTSATAPQGQVAGQHGGAPVIIPPTPGFPTGAGGWGGHAPHQHQQPTGQPQWVGQHPQWTGQSQWTGQQQPQWTGHPPLQQQWQHPQYTGGATGYSQYGQPAYQSAASGYGPHAGYGPQQAGYNQQPYPLQASGQLGGFPSGQ